MSYRVALTAKTAVAKSGLVRASRKNAVAKSGLVRASRKNAVAKSGLVRASRKNAVGGVGLITDRKKFSSAKILSLTFHSSIRCLSNLPLLLSKESSLRRRVGTL